MDRPAGASFAGASFLESARFTNPRLGRASFLTPGGNLPYIALA